MICQLRTLVHPVSLGCYVGLGKTSNARFFEFGVVKVAVSSLFPVVCGHLLRREEKAEVVSVGPAWGWE